MSAAACLPETREIAPARPRLVTRLSDIPLPAWIQPKKDGVRIIIRSDGTIETRSGLPLECERLRQRIAAFGLSDMDCELVAQGGFVATLGMLHTGNGPFTLWGFDRLADPFVPRYATTTDRLRALPAARQIGDASYRPIDSHWVTTRPGLAKLVGDLTGNGEEGVVTRPATSPYGLDALKYKPRHDDEARFIRLEHATTCLILVADYDGHTIRVVARPCDTAILALEPGDPFTFTFHSIHASGLPREARYLRNRKGDPS